MQKKTITTIVPLVGDYVLVQSAVTAICADLAQIARSDSARFQYIFVGDGAYWMQVVDVAGLEAFQVAKFISVTEKSTPAILFNVGAQAAHGDFLTFLWPGVDVRAWHASICELAKSVDENTIALAGPPTTSVHGRDETRSWLADPTGGDHRNYPPGWVEMADYVPMSNCLVQRKAFLESGGFSTSPILQRAFWWEYSLHLSRNNMLRRATAIQQPEPKWTWYEYPFSDDMLISGDMAARRAMLQRNLPATSCLVDWDSADVTSFARNLSRHDASVLARATSVFTRSEIALKEADVSDASSGALRITVLGGPGEPAHNQLCFFNYFAGDLMSVPVTWRSILDTAATRADVFGSDVVIFSRTKSRQACDLMDFCNRAGIPTVYMLDDNWFTVGKDWKEYAAVFHEDGEIYKTFTYCLRHADVALTYNEILAEDMRSVAKQVVVLPTNIDLTHFEPALEKASGRLTIGYAGSPRPDNAAFRALKELSEERDDFDILYMGHAVPESLSTIDSDRVKFEPYVYGYRAYAQMLSRRAPDILLAPLGRTRFESSKCPNKFLEISAVGAAGIYSDVEPYVSAVEDGKTGILVADAADDWKRAMVRLLDDHATRRQISAAARDVLHARYATNVVAPLFGAFIKRIAERRKKCAADVRVAFVAHSPYPAGAERALANFLVNISPSIDAIAIFPKATGPIRDEIEEAGIPVIDADFRPWVPVQGSESERKLEDDHLRRTTQRLSTLFRELELDAVLVNTNVVPAAVFAGAQREIPVILHSHGLISARLSRMLDAARWAAIDMRQLGAASKVVSPSQITADGCRALYNLEPGKVTVVPNGTRCGEWTPLSSDENVVRKFVMLCTMEPNKNIPMFIEAASIYMSFAPGDTEFHIYGVGGHEYVSHLHDLVWHANLTSVFHFHPKERDVDRIYDDALAVVVTSHLESFSFVTIEGMSRGRPVISTKCGGPEGIIVDGFNGYLIEQNDAAALAERMRRLAADIGGAAEMGRNARISIENNFEIVRISEQYSNVIREVALAGDRDVLRQRRLFHSQELSLDFQPGQTQRHVPHAGGMPAEMQSIEALPDISYTGDDTLEYSYTRQFSGHRIVSLRHASVLAAHSRGLMPRVKRRFVLGRNIWPMINPVFSEIKSYCQHRQWNFSRKLRLGENLTEVPFVEYLVDINGAPFEKIEFAIELASVGMNGAIGLELVDESGKIVANVVRALKEIDPFRPVRLVVGGIGGLQSGRFLMRFFVRDAEGPVWIYELSRRRRMGLSRPDRLPFINVS
ncbi:glycosyltransferase [Burkholderia sp. Ac-20353]|uniref:glycosyltransferase n=1 Tax=Burkholderia sp. Ac-20353 TaxID=2703894 RepID=UPI00197BA41B|nr:glycosyltransferase [Burkholderia sp. Ac-20353]